MSTYEILKNDAIHANDARVRDDVKYEATILLNENKITQEEFLVIMNILSYQ